jgi:DNA-binding NarL/FixJ family response regulator
MLPGNAMSVANPRPEADGHTTILIVDDDVQFCGAAAELLADRGFRVVGHAATAQEAVAERRRLRPDGILLDIRLPDGYGVTLVETLRAGPRPPRIVLTSSDATAVAPEQLRASGASAFIPKAKLAISDLSAFFNGDGAG